MAILKEKSGLSNDDIRKLRSLRVGAPLDIQINTPVATKRARTELVGIDGTRSLIMQFPDETKWGNVREFIYNDNTMIVRAILEEDSGEIIAFKVKITMILTKPGHLVFTSFPLSLQSMDLRSEKRTRASISAMLLDPDGKLELASGILTDISAGGCRIEVPATALKQKISTGQSIKLRAKQASGEGLPATVMNAKVLGRTVYYGMRFDVSDYSVEQITDILMERG